MVKDANIRDVGGAILYTTLISRIAYGILSTICFKQHLVPSLLGDVVAGVVVCLILQGVTKPVMRVGRGRGEGEREAALEDALHVLGGDGGLAVGGDGVKEVTGVGLGRTHKGGGVAAVDTVGIKVEAPHVVVALRPLPRQDNRIWASVATL